MYHRPVVNTAMDSRQFISERKDSRLSKMSNAADMKKYWAAITTIQKEGHQNVSMKYILIFASSQILTVGGTLIRRRLAQGRTSERVSSRYHVRIPVEVAIADLFHFDA